MSRSLELRRTRRAALAAACLLGMATPAPGRFPPSHAAPVAPHFAAPVAPPSHAPGTGKPIVSGPVGKEVDAFFRDPKHFPAGFSGVVLVAVDGKVVLEQGYGVADAAAKREMPHDALFDWASVTKQFTAAALLKLQMQKKLDLDDPITRHFPEAGKDKAKVRVRHLLDHTSGIPHDVDLKGESLFERDTTVRAILAAPLASEPGGKWVYNNVAYFLAGALVERASGKTYESYLREQLFEPAGMKGAGFIGDGKLEDERVPLEERGTGPRFTYGPRLSWGYRGAGGAVASTRDLLAWDQALRGDKVLNKAAKKELYEPHLENYALGWTVEKGPGGLRVAHGGAVGTIRTYYLRVLDEPLLLAFACNFVPDQDVRVIAQQVEQVIRNAR